MDAVLLVVLLLLLVVDVVEFPTWALWGLPAIRNCTLTNAFHRGERIACETFFSTEREREKEREQQAQTQKKRPFFPERERTASTNSKKESCMQNVNSVFNTEEKRNRCLGKTPSSASCCSYSQLNSLGGTRVCNCTLRSAFHRVGGLHVWHLIIILVPLHMGSHTMSSKDLISPFLEGGCSYMKVQRLKRFKRTLFICYMKVQTHERFKRTLFVCYMKGLTGLKIIPT